jgi:23S rRNA (pseudouridine1915-N3)-methyltransferase
MFDMQIIIAAVGRLKAGPESELFEHYIERAAQQGTACGLGGISIREIAEDKAQTANQRRRNEAAGLVTGLPQKAVKVALDETGKMLSSMDFANRLARWRDDGKGAIWFFIGGPDGLANDITASAGEIMALGRLTWPHRLARVLLAEQIYRATTILTGHPYHRA